MDSLFRSKFEGFLAFFLAHCRGMRPPAPDDGSPPDDWNYGNYGELWGIMGNYVELWGIMGNYGELWGIMGNYGELWGIMGNDGELWWNLGGIMGNYPPSSRKMVS